jgi:RNA polymerase sigma factor (sigma-70 family)
VAISSPSATDGALVEAVRAGEDAAFEELYRRYRRRISAFVFRFVRDEGRAEDLTQETFLSALRRMRDTDCAIAFKPWIYEIARNAAIDLYRRSSRAEEISISPGAALRAEDRRRLVGSTAPDSALDVKERFEHFRGALDEMSDTHHRILVLRELEGRSYREIAERMELTAPAVESTLFRARRRLEQEYVELDTGRRCASMRAVIARLAEGVDSPRDLRSLERHARYCSLCRRRARELGVEPVRHPGRAAALLPVPYFMRRRRDSGARADAWSPALTPGVEGAGALAGKAVALLAAAALVGGGGATLGGVGPLAPDARSPAETSPAGGTGDALDASTGPAARGGGPAAGGGDRTGSASPGAGRGEGTPLGPSTGGAGRPDSAPGGFGLPGLPGLPDLHESGLPGLPPVGAPDLGLPEVPDVPSLPTVPPVDVPEGDSPELPSVPDFDLPPVPQASMPPIPAASLPPVDTGAVTSSLADASASLPPVPLP